MPTFISSSHRAQLIALVATSSQMMSALRAARDLRLPSWCIGAGAIRNLVWDHLHRFERPAPPADIDVVFHDPADLSKEREHASQLILSAVLPHHTWEVVNQAAVHHWYQSHNSQAFPPLTSLAEGVASWPEFATCVGVTLTDSDDLEVVAPHGLDDLFNMVVRWNPARASRAVYLERIAKKRLSERWPLVQVVLS